MPGPDLANGRELFSAHRGAAVSSFIYPSGAGGRLFPPNRDRILALAPR